MPTTLTIELPWACVTQGCSEEGKIELVTIDDDHHSPICFMCRKPMLRVRAPGASIDNDPPQVG